jgi:hypothetical protein
MLPITPSTPADNIHRCDEINDDRSTMSGCWIRRFTNRS